MSADILIVDDEADIRELVAGILEDEGYETRMAANSDQCLAEIAHRRPSLMILDIWLRGSKLDGIEILQAVKKDQPDLPILMISGHGNIETAVQAIKLGAYDWLRVQFELMQADLAERTNEISLTLSRNHSRRSGSSSLSTGCWKQFGCAGKSRSLKPGEAS